MKRTDVREAFVELRAQGWSYARIAQELEVSKQTLINWSKELQPELQNLREIQLDALREKFFLGRQHRIQLLGEQLGRIKEELGKRDLSDVPTKDVFAMFMKCAEVMKAEMADLEFTGEEPLVQELELTRPTTWRA